MFAMIIHTDNMYSVIGSYTRDRLEEIAISYIETFLKEIKLKSEGQFSQIESDIKDALDAKELDYCLSILESLGKQINKTLVIRIVKAEMLLDS